MLPSLGRRLLLRMAAGMPFLARRPASAYTRLPYITHRYPRRFDDVRDGFSVGDLWVTPAGGTWQASGVNPGRAIWSPITAPHARPLDLVPGVAAAAFGLVRLNTGYTGPALQVRRTADGQVRDVGFDASGTLNTAALGAFLAGGDGTVSRWYDQSGNAADAVQTDPARQPAILGGSTGLAPVVSFNGPIGATVSIRPKSLAIAFRRPVATTSCGFLLSARIASSARLVGLMRWQTGGNGLTLVSGRARAPSLQGFGVENSRRAAFIPTSSLATSGMLLLPDGQVTLMQGNQVDATSVSYPIRRSAPAASLGIDVSDNTAGCSLFDAAAAVFLAEVPTPRQLSLLQGALEALTGGEPQVTDTLITDGDSITQGLSISGAVRLTGYPSKLPPLLVRPRRIYNVAVSGDTMSGRLRNVANNVLSLIRPLDRTVVTICAGTNDLLSNPDAPIGAELQEYCRTVRAAGARVVVGTMLPRRQYTGPREAARQAYNSMIRSSGLALADAIADFAADPVIGPPGAAANTSLYGDGTHPTDVGYSHMAPIMAAAINALG